MNVLLIEDHSLVAKSTADLVQSICPGAAVTICEDGRAARAALAKAAEEPWHRILLDLNVPDVSGLALASVIEDCGLAPITVVITGDSNAAHLLDLKAMGFLGFLPKTLSFTVLSHSLGELLLRDQPLFLSEESPRRAVRRITRRQAQVLQGLARGLRPAEIALEMEITEKAVKAHIDDASFALGVDGQAQAISEARRLGLLTPGSHRN